MAGLLDALRGGGAGRALGIRNFRIYFAGLMVSISGTWMQSTAQAWLVLKLTDSPLALGTVAALQSLPVMLLTLFGGAVADRLPRRKLLYVTQGLGALQAVALGALALHGIAEVWHIYVLAIGLGLINALDNPVRQSFIGELVPVSVLPNAIALNSMAQNLGRILGPTLGGLTIAGFGVGAAFFINAATFSGTIIALLLLDPSALHVAGTRPRGNVFRQIGEAAHFAWSQPSILVLLIGAAFIGMFGQNFATMVPLVAIYLVHADAAQFGLLNSGLGTGSMLAAFVMSMSGPPSIGRILLAGCCFALFLVAVSQSSWLPLSCLFFAGVGASVITFNASVQTSMQMQAPPEMRGRFASMLHLLGAGSSPIGQLLTGAVASNAAVWFAVGLNGVMCAVGMLMAGLYFLRKSRQGTPFAIATPLQAPDPTAPKGASLAISPKR
ncbi:MFS transporter [uncultured Alsobacter sp.]|uniref:MFS transporter n=1 Tax=uncultured Alsobacter sp. TaxID=1748258 RepID=UPI0025D4A61E|nr:MFS transporter [uncultured Alsobacter sp.]